MPSPTRFTDRTAAGRALAEALEPYAGRDLVVLALPRGGVPVAAEVASALDAPLDVLVVRKVGAPSRPELAMGAIAMVAGTIETYRDDDLVARLGGGQAFDDVAARELAELRRRDARYRAGRDPSTIRGATVLLVDDGFATGATMRVAVAAARTLRPERVVVAAPVGSQEACEALRHVADEVVCLATPERFRAVGEWYDTFPQTTDGEVTRLLEAGIREGSDDDDR
ncbi:phosphoribosyltransferase [Microbacterium sp. GXF7504]